MSGTIRRKLRSEITRENHNEDADEGTAARTRPLSYEEIMLKRESKKKLDDFKEKAADREGSKHEETVMISDHHRRDTNPTSAKNSRDYAREASSRKKEEKTARVEDSHGKRKSKESRDVENRSKDKHEKGIKGIAETLKKDGRGHGRNKLDEPSRDDSKHGHEKSHVHGRNKLDEPSRDDSKHGHEKRHHRDFGIHDRHMDRSKAPERESKRKDRGGDDEKYRMRNQVKKHDSGHKQTEISERKEQAEPSNSCHDETNSKRRRSRSPERVADKGKPLSSSPKTRKNVSSHGHDHEDLSSHSQRERSRYNSDFDRKMSSNGSGSHHRRHGGSSSGLGGYSPRKRKTEAAVKTPSPPVRSPERKSAGWDLTPSGGDGNLSISVASVPQQLPQSLSSKMIELAGGVSIASNMGKSLPAFLSNNLSSFKETSIDSIQLTQATRPMRRLYIDNVPSTTSEKDIMEYFNNFLLSSGANHIRSARPCISCMIHREKRQALVEFLTPEDASAVLYFDGKSLFGSIVKVRRPKDFIGAAVRMKNPPSLSLLSGSSEKSKARANIISDIVNDSPHKIFVGGIAKGISSEKIMEIVSAFGPLNAFRFEVSEDLNEPCAFLEYADQSVTSKACAGLNGMKLGGRVLTVAQAIQHITELEEYQRMPTYEIPKHVKPLLESPTQVLKLNNVLDQKAIELLSQTDLEEIIEDVRLECSRFGSVVSINVVKTSNVHSAISDTKEVTNDTKPLQFVGERDPKGGHLNLQSTEVCLDHGGDESGDELSSKIEEHGDRVKESGHRDSSPTTVGATGTRNAEDIREADKIVPKNCDDGAANQPQEVTVTDCSTVKNGIKTEGSDVECEDVHSRKSDMCPSEEKDTDESVDNEIDNEISSLVDMPASDKARHTLGDHIHVANEITTPNIRAPENCVKDESVSEVGNVFEVGCVLVEFRRPEASCMAAHCLHGRTFDDRVVTVEYVPLDAYRARFPK